MPVGLPISITKLLKKLWQWLLICIDLTVLTETESLTFRLSDYFQPIPTYYRWLIPIFSLANMLEQHVILASASSNRPCHDA